MLKCMTFCFLLLLGGACTTSYAKQTPPIDGAATPNVIIFLIDDMGLMDTSVPFLTDDQGKAKTYPLNHFYRTPQMARLANQGIRFSQFYTMSVCSPTRISLLTGQTSARHQTTNFINPLRQNTNPGTPPNWRWAGLNKKSVTLPRLLQGRGYRTIHIGKGHLGPELHEGRDPKVSGFDVNIGGGSFGLPPSYYGRDGYGKYKKRRSQLAVPHLEKYHKPDIFLTEALTLEAKDQLTEVVKAKQPFFLHMSHYAVHAPFNTDPRFIKHYATSDHSSSTKAFATLVEGIDKSLGDLMDHLTELNVAEETLIIFIGDNGSNAPIADAHTIGSSAPIRGKKGSHYEGGMRVPFIAAWAKPNANHPMQKRLPIPHGQIQTQLASINDLFPTIMSLTQTATPTSHPIDGYPLQTLLSGQVDVAHPDTFLMHFPHDHNSDYFTVYRNGDWKLIYHYFPTEVSNNQHYQLYNLAKDPFESTNLATTEPSRLKAMVTEMIKQLDDRNAIYPVDKQTNQGPIRPIVP